LAALTAAATGYKDAIMQPSTSFADIGRTATAVTPLE
jgi:hypothetical protein